MAADPHPIVEECVALLAALASPDADDDATQYVLTEESAGSLRTALEKLRGGSTLPKAIADLATLSLYLAGKGSIAAGSAVADVLESFVDELEQMHAAGVEGAKAATDAVGKFRDFQGGGEAPQVLGGDGSRPEGSVPGGPMARFAALLPDEKS
jgi:hypothetical protein